VRHLFGLGSRLKQPDDLVGTISQVFATHKMGALDLNLLNVRRLVELLSKVIVLRFEIIVLTKEMQARFIASLIWSI
jgi:hypothetical protein